MKGLYIRWTVLVLIFGSITFLGVLRYNREVKTISPAKVSAQGEKSELRLMGMIEAGTFERGSEGEPTRFVLSGEGEKITVVFSGEDTDESLRELKTIVALGKWEAGKNQFAASALALNPNYGFVTSAYVFSLLPLAFFLFYMERRVSLLYVMIKEEKVYQSETQA